MGVEEEGEEKLTKDASRQSEGIVQHPLVVLSLCFLTKLGGRFGYFLIFSGRGGEGEFEVPGRGVGLGFSLKIPGGGGGCFQEGEGPEGVCGKSGKFGGGAKYFFSGPKRPPRKEKAKHLSYKACSGTGNICI